ncbi:MAG: hypothetical protein GC139_10520 [Sideroxydans sp.]|nr:hypothetical protein [Sideroxydans sp.]
MKLPVRTASDYADAQRALLPPGAAFDWPAGGFGDALLLGMGQELARIGSDAQVVLDNAIEQHRPINGNWNISEYRKVAEAAIAGVAETMPRKTFAVGSTVGDRLWSIAAPGLNFPVQLLQVDHLLGPLRVGSTVGDRAWGTRARYVMRVRYYRSVVDPKPLWDALAAFKQAHVYLWFEDITGVGGNYGQN